MRRLVLPRSKRARRITVIAAAVVLTSIIGVGAAFAIRDARTLTPCEAAVDTVERIRDADPDVAAQMTDSHAIMLRRLAIDDFVDVEGDTSPRLAQHLRRVADYLDALHGRASADEFTRGNTGMEIDALIDYCGNE